MLFKLFGVYLFARVDVHISEHRSFEVVVELPPALAGGNRTVFLPRGVIMRFVLPFDLVLLLARVKGRNGETDQVLEVLLLDRIWI